MKNKQALQGLSVEIPEAKGTPDRPDKGWSEKAYEQSPLPKAGGKDLSQDNDVITQYIPPSNQDGEGAPHQTSKPARRSWTSILCCMRPQDEGYRQTSNRGAYTPRRNHPVPPPYHGSAVIPPMQARDKGKKTLVLDLDETLVHSSFKPVANADYVIPVEIDNKVTDVYVIKRPWVDQFMVAMGEAFEVVVFTASLAKYADPLLDLLDEKNLVRWRLFRDSCCPYEGNYVKDLSRLGRPPEDVIIIDNSPHSYIFQPENAIPIGTFIGDTHDQDLLDLIPFLLSVREHDDVREVLEKRFPNRPVARLY
mmetsp:Transcript_19439/g.42530  ORF Transcript_19439/g.42530 Transcript_19439/m.42530 type:complete len:308 (-) Transcript_19439:210-1133(-)|eukprot:CAMPEP_0118926320 /NCGR_PEP_ID=MMETSP1169-20130426/4037_1 /TAXON_ID=36882 /ORGANISM="Pyramimonas obovata, Strain CCMP722" /LENGTH=307 /DNA_ID=CAMNT_0006867851 /DNA_START=466 /DNA_END=1389 /DNA_ORIENTATION=-